jgi:hypothetical protein
MNNEAYSIPNAARAAGIGITKMYQLVGNGDVESRRLGSRTLVLAESLRTYIVNLPPADIRERPRIGAPITA